MRSFCILIVCLFLSAFIDGAVSSASEKEFEFRQLGLIWTAAYDQNEQVYFSIFENDKWSIPVQVSDSKNFVFHATGTLGNDGTIWVVWTQADKKAKYLYSSKYDGVDWSKPVKIDTGMKDNREAVIAIGSNGMPWIAWTAVDNKYSDVFWSKWNGTHWSKAKKAHVDDSVPDVHPSLAVNDAGEMRLSWQTFSEGTPVAVSLLWNGTLWDESSSDFIKKNMNIQKNRILAFPRLPKNIQEQFKASFLYRDDYGTGSLPVNPK